MSVNNVGTSGTSYTPDASVNLQATSKAAGEALVSMDPKKVMEALVALQQSLDAMPAQSNAGLTNRNGAPSIGGVTLAFSPEDMAAALLALQGKTQDQQMKNATQGIMIDQQKMADNNAKQLDKINDWITKCAEAAEKAKAATASNWFSTIFGFVAAVVSLVVAAVATVATGGAAAPLLAMAVIGVVTTSISLVNQVRATQEPPQDPIDSFSTAVGKLMSNMLVEFGMDKDKADKLGSTLSGLFGVMTGAVLIDPAFAGQLMGGIAEAFGADETQVAIVKASFTLLAGLATAVVMMVACGKIPAGEVVNGMTKILDMTSKVGGLLTAGLAVGAGGAAISSGIATIEQGHLQKDADSKLVDKKKLDAMLVEMQAAAEQAKEDLKKLLDEIQNGMATVSAMISAGGESRSQIATNMGGQRI
jgi:transloator